MDGDGSKLMTRWTTDVENPPFIVGVIKEYNPYNYGFMSITLW
jgi:hypothetical protein